MMEVFPEYPHKRPTSVHTWTGWPATFNVLIPLVISRQPRKVKNGRDLETSSKPSICFRSWCRYPIQHQDKPSWHHLTHTQAWITSLLLSINTEKGRLSRQTISNPLYLWTRGLSLAVPGNLAFVRKTCLDSERALPDTFGLGPEVFEEVHS